MTAKEQKAFMELGQTLEKSTREWWNYRTVCRANSQIFEKVAWNGEFWRDLRRTWRLDRERSVLLDTSKRITNIPESAAQNGSEANDRKTDELYRSARLNRDDYSSHKRDKVRETTDDQKGTNASVTNKFINSESKRPMRCFVCDKVGHKSVDCRVRTQPNTIVRSERGIRCYICSAFGHKTVDCPES